MHERQRIFLKRQRNEPPPWTKDRVLAGYKFCNVYREQDTVTRWIRENWCGGQFAPHKNLWFAMCIARQINWPPALAAIGFPWEWKPDEALAILQNRAQRKEKNYSSAYMLTAQGFTGVDKPTITVKHVLQSVYNKAWKQPPPFTSLEAAFNWFLEPEPKLYGWGPFTAYEVVTDLRHTRYLSEAPDIQTWANAGPGAKRGLNRLYKRPLDYKFVGVQALHEMRELLAWLKCERDTNLLPQLEMRDVEHVCCELDKYFRAEEQIAKGIPVTIEKYTPPDPRLF